MLRLCWLALSAVWLVSCNAQSRDVREPQQGRNVAEAVGESQLAIELPPGDRERLVALTQLERTASESNDPAELARFAAALVELEDYDTALSLLDGAATRAAEPLLSAIRNETGIAYLRRGLSQQDPLDLLMAAEQFENAGTEAATANRRTTLHRLGLQASVPNAEGSLPPPQPSRKELFDDEFAELLDKIANGEYEQPLEQARRMARSDAWFMAESTRRHLFGLWGRQYSGEDDRHTSTLGLLREVAQVFATSSQDSMMTDTVSCIERALEGPSVGASSVAEGLVEFEQGAIAFEEQRSQEMVGHFESARELLSETSCSFALWSDLYLGLAIYFQNVSNGIEALETLLLTIEERPYPTLRGRAHWFLATAEMVHTNYGKSLEHLELTERHLGIMGGRDATAFVDVLFAETLTRIGEHSAAWQRRWQAFQDVPEVQSLRRQTAMWVEAIGSLERQGRLDLAGPLIDEALAVVEHWGDPTISIVYSFRARHRLRTGQVESAQADIAAARRNVLRWPQGPLNDLVRKLHDLDAGEVLAAVDPRAGAAALATAIDNQRDVDRRDDVLEYLPIRAAALLRLGQLDEAERDLEEAVAWAQQAIRSASDPHQRGYLWHRARDSFEQLVTLELEQGSTLEALRHGESYLRNRLPLSGLRSAATETELRELSSRLEPSDLLVNFFISGDTIHGWATASGNCVAFRSGSTHELGQHLNRFEAALEIGSREQLLDALGKLDDQLLAPAIDALPADLIFTRLIVVPDGVVARVPFPALYDADAREHRIEHLVVTSFPHLALLEERLQKEWAPSISEDQDRPRSALGVAVSAELIISGHRLPALPIAETETRAILELYPEGQLLAVPNLDKNSLLTALAQGPDVVHIAAHSLANEESALLSYLALPGLEPRLTVAEVLRIGTFDPQLVVLATCQGGNPLSRSAPEASLAGALMAVGASAVLATPAELEDGEATAFLVKFHREVAAGIDPAVALRRVAIAALSSNEEPDLVWMRFQVAGGIS